MRMTSKFFTFVLHHPLWTMSLAVILLIAGLNVAAFMHARTMLHFTTGGVRTQKPEDLSPLAKLRVLSSGVRLPRPENDSDPLSEGMSFSVHQLESPMQPRLEAWHIPHSNPRGAALLLHGYGACKSDMMLEAKAFRDLSFDVVMIDFRGSGGSEGNSTSIGYHEALDAAAGARLTRTLCPGLPLLVYGQSMGGAAALRACHLDIMDADALVLEGVFATTLGTVRNRFRLMKLPSFLFAETLVFWGGFQLDFPAFSHNPVTYAASTKSPTLFMHGKSDPRAKIDEITSVFDAITASKDIVVFDEAGHEPCLASDPAKWKEGLEKFLRNCPEFSTGSTGRKDTGDTRDNATAFIAGAAETAGPLDCSVPFSPTPDMLEYFQFYGLDFPGVDHYFGTFASGSYSLAAHAFVPASPRGTVVLVHGYYDHVGVLRHLIEFLLARGYAVCAYDQPGHGLSSGERASIGDFGEYSEVLRALMRRCRRDLPGPYHLVAHSMGCPIAIDTLRDEEMAGLFDKVVLLAPLVRSVLWRTAGVGESVAGVFVDSVPRTFRRNSSDPSFLEFTKNDPLQPRRVPMKWSEALRRWNDRYETAPGIDMPVKIIQGTGDTTVHWRYNLPSLAEKIPKAQISKVPGAGHQLMNESERIRKKVFHEIALYLENDVQ